MRFGLDQGMNEFPMSSIHCKAYGCPHVTLWHPMGCVFSYYMTQYDVSYDVIWLCWPTLNGHIAMWPMVCGSSFCSLIQSTPTRQWSSLLSPRKRAPDTGQVSQMKPPCLLRANPAAQHLWIAMGQPGFCILKPCTKNRIVWVLLSTDLVTSLEEFCFSVMRSQTPEGSQRLRTSRLKAWAVYRGLYDLQNNMGPFGICPQIVMKSWTCPKAAFSRWYVVICCYTVDTFLSTWPRVFLALIALQWCFVASVASDSGNIGNISESRTSRHPGRFAVLVLVVLAPSNLCKNQSCSEALWGFCRETGIW